MDEQLWQQRFAAVAEHQPLEPLDVAADLARGRARLRFRRIAATGTAILASVVVVGGGVAAAEFSGVSRTDGSAPVAGGAGRISSDAASSASPTTPGNGDTGKDPGLDAHDLYNDTTEFRFATYDIVAEYLDPAKKYLNYSTRSLQSASNSDGTRTLGIKLGWKVPGQPGEGLVQIAVSDIHAIHSRLECGLEVAAKCETLTLDNGQKIEVGEARNGVYDVVYRRSDGIDVEVIVNPLLGNNSMVPVKEMKIDRVDVYRLVQDERLNLPRSN